MKIKKVPFTEKHLLITYGWLNDPEIKKLTNTKNFTKEDQKKWFLSIKDDIYYKIWLISIDDKPVGVFGIKNIKDQRGEYWGYIGEKAYWGQGIGNWMIDESLEFCKKNNFISLYLNVLKTNLRAVKLYEKKGFYEVSSDVEMIKMEMKL